MSRVIFEHVNHVVQINEWVINGNDIHIVTAGTDTGDQTETKNITFRSKIAILSPKIAIRSQKYPQIASFLWGEAP